MYEFKDIDRPMQEAVQIEKIRLNNRKWDLFKRQFEEQVLKQGYYERLKLKVWKLKFENHKLLISCSN